MSETNWLVLVQEVAFTCNSYRNASISYSPHEEMHGAQLRTKADCTFTFNQPLESLMSRTTVNKQGMLGRKYVLATLERNLKLILRKE